MGATRSILAAALAISVLLASRTPGNPQFVFANDVRSVSSQGVIGTTTVYSRSQTGPGTFDPFNGDASGSGETNFLALTSTATQISVLTSNAIYATNLVRCSYNYTYSGPPGSAPYGTAYANNAFEITFEVPAPVLCALSGIHIATGDLFGAPTVYLKSTHYGTITSIGGQNYSWEYLGVLQPDTYVFNLDVPLGFSAFYNPPYTADMAAVRTSCGLTVIPPPSIEANPRSMTVSPGDSASFNVVATSDARAGLLSYQWFFGGVSLPGATNSTLALTNVTGSQAGSYWAVVSSLAGSSTSSPAVLSLLSLSRYAGLTIAGQVGDTYRVDYRTVLTPTNWTPLTNFVLPSTPFLFIDTSSPDSPQRFYRAIIQ